MKIMWRGYNEIEGLYGFNTAIICLHVYLFSGITFSGSEGLYGQYFTWLAATTFGDGD